ncbi:MAG: hypothetical protein D3909_03490, partial [Candidatus Electrothrix sp. ATG1]|nr:hypothetical protein [Candidatus Electrothrix sp. ATG1]
RPEVILQHEAEVLGTGGGLRKALEHFRDEPVLVMNGDIFHDIDLRSLMATHAAGSASVTMALHDYPRFNSVQIQGEQVCGFPEDENSDSKSTRDLLAFTGIHVVNREIIEQIPANCFFHIIDLYKELAEAKKIGFTRINDCFWQDMGTPDDYLDLHRHLLSTGTPAWQIHESAHIGKNVNLKEWGAVGAGAVIGDGAKLAQCVIWGDAQIKAGAELTGEIIIPDGKV